MKIKTYPLQFTEEKLNAIAEEAKKRNQSIKDFMLNAIEHSLGNVNVGKEGK